MQIKDIRHAFEEHLSAINENSNEIQVLFDYLQEMEMKMENLTQRLDQLQLAEPAKPLLQPLVEEERELFLVMYTEQLPVSCKELSEKTRLEEGVVTELISSLISKGIPLQRTFSNNQFFFSIEGKFKELQAKENIVNVSLSSFLE
jgi:predicted nuclease with TOPRIM domain